MRKIFFCVVFALFCGVLAGQSVKDVAKVEVLRHDTLKVENYVVEKYVKKNGEEGYKAKWGGKAINVSDRDGAIITNGSSAYVVIAIYNNGEIVRKKLISKK